MNRLVQFFPLFLLCGLVIGAAPKLDHAERIASLIDPTKLSTLQDRGAIPRVHKIVYQLEMARRQGINLTTTINKAMKLVGINNPAQASLLRASLLRNHAIALRLLCLNSEGLEEMKQGNSPTIRGGPYAGDELSVDHIIPLAVCPELDNVLANLELMPLRLNQRKNAKIGQRQRATAQKFYAAGMLSKGGLKAVLSK